MTEEFNLSENKSFYFKVHTSELFQRIIEMDIKMGSGVLKNPLNIFRNLLIQVGQRASEINDPILNKLMCDLAIYSISDPYDKDYNYKLVMKIRRTGEKLK